MPTIDVTWLGYFMAGVALYYTLLFVFSLRLFRRKPERPSGRGPFMALVVPAHNEEGVIEQTLSALVRVRYDHFLVLVMNDGSIDRTSERAHAFEASGRVFVIDRPPAVAGRGKGAVLNHAFEILSDLVDRQDPRLDGRGTDEVVVGVLDADGVLDEHALADVAPLFADPRVGGAQVGVRILNAHHGLLARCQDMEFVGFSHLAQAARDRIGSVGLGGNGQFTRLSALRSLERPPWTDCLTEDLDLGLSLTHLGWRIRFCSTAWVAQQGVVTLRAWLKQRTRWAQGHYQCWAHFPRLLASGKAPLLTRLDLSVYLLFVTVVMFVTANLVITVAGALGLVWLSNDFIGFMPLGLPKNLMTELLGVGPVVIFLVRYQQQSRFRFRAWELAAFGAVFASYAYLWALATLWAWARMLAGQDGWSKTARVEPGRSVS
jgi:cellulose synthase/poly-beta-1,6-N-acetylglucosamine synthase-like glycosyltransferase